MRDLRSRFARLIPPAAGALAAALRLPHLDWGLPDIEEEALPMKKAFDMWGWETGQLALNPETAGWPSLSFHVHLLLQHLHYLVGRALGWFHDRNDYYVAYRVDPSDVALLARGLSVLASAVTVFVATRIALRLAGWPAALGVGALLASSPLLVEHGQMVTPDILLLMFAVLAVERILDIEERGRTRDYVWAAIWVGLGAASKYTPALLTVSIYAAHLLRRRREGQSLRLLGLDDRRLGYGALAAILSFCLASPYTFASMETLRRDFAYQALHMSAGHFGHEEQGIGLVHYSVDVLPRAMGWPAFLLASVALILAAIRRRGSWLVVLACVLPFYLVLGSLSTSFDRYMLPIVPVLALGLAALWKEWIVPHVPRARLRWALGLVLLTVICIPPLRASLDHLSLQGRSSTQQVAREWIMAHASPETTTLAMEMYSPALPTNLRGDLLKDPVFQRLNDPQQQTLLDLPHFHSQYIPMYATRTQLSAYYYDLRHYLAYDYIVITGSVWRRYQAQPDLFPEQVQFYRDLELYARQVAHFTPDGRMRGPAIRIFELGRAAERRLLADRGPLPQSSYRRYADRLHSPHLRVFLERVALHANVRERFDVAARYYGELYDISAPQDRALIAERRAYSELRAGNVHTAERLYGEVLAQDPRHAAALGNMGFIFDRTGRHEQAEAYYERCIAADADGEAAKWARARLQNLRRRSEP